MARLKDQGKIIGFPHRPGMGGPGSFQSRFEKALQEHGWKVAYAGECKHPDLIMIVGGTKRIGWLLKMKLKGIPIIYRLDGLAWLHRHKKVGIKEYLLAEVRNITSKWIHAFLVNHIIYQSKFVRDWWERDGWRKQKEYSIIYNGVSESEYLQPLDKQPTEKRLVILEGTVDYSPFAVDLLNILASDLPDDIAIEVYGRFVNLSNRVKLNSRIQYFGSIPRERVFEVLHGSVYLSLDVNPACPNTVIEAMAVGAPVVGFKTGSLPEIIRNDSGIMVSYGSNPWKLKLPDSKLLKEGIIQCFEKYGKFSKNAKQTFRERFTLKLVVKKYIILMSNIINQKQNL